MKLTLALLAFAAACASPVDEPSVTERTCDTWGCGTNSATVGDGLIFDALDSSGVTDNAAGLRIVGATASDGTAVKVYVQRHYLNADALDGSRSYRFSQLAGTVIRLYDDYTGVKYEVLVSKVQLQSITFWAGAPEYVPFYELMVRKLGETKWVDYACNDVITTDPHWTGVEHSALMFQWDRYDAVHKTVSETAPSDPWFNIACAATAPAKIHLMRHTRAGSYDNYGVIRWDTTVDQRQAVLKMLTADYCGTGHSFTVDGVPLIYDTANGLYTDSRPMSAKESMWKSGGAICLDTPRYASMSEILSVCGYVPPPCNGFTDWTSRSYVISGEP